MEERKEIEKIVISRETNVPEPKVIIKRLSSPQTPDLEESWELAVMKYKIPFLELDKYIPIQENVKGEPRFYLIQPINKDFGDYKILEIIGMNKSEYSVIEITDKDLIKKIKSDACLF